MAAAFDDSDLEHQARAMIGQFVLLYSRLDTNLTLYVASRRDPQAQQAALSRLQGASFQAKLKKLPPVVFNAYAGHKECSAQWSAWLVRADDLRLKRNDFIHGRWGFSEGLGIAANIVGLPGSPEQTETRYTIEQPRSEVESAQQVLHDFHTLADRWPH